MEYSDIVITNSSDGYRVHATGYIPNGDRINSFGYINTMKFSTFDKDNDMDGINCAKKYGGGWWYIGGPGVTCSYVQLNSKHGPTWDNNRFWTYSSMMIR